MTQDNLASVKIRPALPADFDAITEISAEALPDLATDENRSNYESDLRNWRKAKRSIRVAESGGKIVGYVSIGPYKGTGGADLHSASATLHQIAVLDAHRGQGVGKALLNEATRAAKGFGAGIIFAAVNDQSAPFYQAHGWSVGDAGEGFAFVEREKAGDAGERAAGDIVGLLDKASKPRSGAVNLPGGFSRMAFLVLDSHEIRLAFHFLPTEANPDSKPLEAVFERVAVDSEAILALPLSTLLMVAGDLSRVLGPKKARELVDRWVAESGEGGDVPRRLRSPNNSVSEIFDYLFGAS